MLTTATDFFSRPLKVSRGSYVPPTADSAEDRSDHHPESKRLSYQLSVMDEHPVEDQWRHGPDSSEWKLYRPESPGNSPVYIAKGVFKRHHRPQQAARPREEDQREQLLRQLYEQQKIELLQQKPLEQQVNP